MLREQDFYREMTDLVSSNFFQEDLKRTAIDFIEYKQKEQALFGELTVIHYKMFNGASNEIYTVAAAVELLILALDIIDDLQDQDNLKTPWLQIDQGISLNVAIGFLTAGQQAIFETSFNDNDKQRTLKYIQRFLIRSINGQHEDLLNTVQSEEDYIKMVKKKSGSLIGLACLIGTSLATSNYHDLVLDYGINIGVIGQIENDIRDICRWEVKNDIQKKRKTLPTLYLLRGFSDVDQLIQTYYDGKIDYNTLLDHKDNVLHLIQKSGALLYANVILKKYQKKVCNKIKVLPVDETFKANLLQYVQ